ncbi:MAG: PRC-barrel domain-containing protein [Paracoccus sp. (in: a-proteobacteria)]|uniref:PRC-barrel domain-containing protein n=1 Tax=Paracoccus sp. TaxID=267 RepID=UPI0026DFF769|nr:PRC-barrel domain-containing protein [Paracoccus sp. (in: a-proteobacteria)]MDO5613684.1 PRC-barrel domain-containing protein [Paracoccus sp. (in: a-proteobacteria)]
MRHILLTTALILPLAAAPALAQSDTATPPPVEQPAEQPADQAAQAAQDAADSAAEAASDAATAVEDAARDAAHDAAEATEHAADGVADALDEASTAVADAVPGDGAAIIRDQAANELRLDWIIGTNVHDPEGTTVGSINDIILDGDTGRISAAIIGVGGFLGIGEKQIAVAWDRLAINFDANEITTTLTRDEADAAPEYVFRDRESAPSGAGAPAATGN